MSVADLARLLSEMVTPVNSTYPDCTTRREFSPGNACTRVTLYTLSFCQDSQGTHAHVCLNRTQINLDTSPTGCTCGEEFAPNWFDATMSSNPLVSTLTNVPTQPLLANNPNLDHPAQCEVDAAAASTFIPVGFTNWVDHEPSVDALSPYASMRNISAPPPPAPALLRHQDSESDDGQLVSTGMIILLSLILLGLLVFLRIILVA